MHSYEGIFHMNRSSDNISTRPDNRSTLTRKSAAMSDTPRERLYGPVTWFCI